MAYALQAAASGERILENRLNYLQGGPKPVTESGG